MKLKFNSLNSILGCVSLLLINTQFSLNLAAEEPLGVQLNKEIKKG